MRTTRDRILASASVLRVLAEDNEHPVPLVMLKVLADLTWVLTDLNGRIEVLEAEAGHG